MNYTIKAQMAIMQAFADGKAIEAKLKNESEWYVVENPNWNWGLYDYRVWDDPVSVLYDADDQFYGVFAENNFVWSFRTKANAEACAEAVRKDILGESVSSNGILAAANKIADQIIKKAEACKAANAPKTAPKAEKEAVKDESIKKAFQKKGVAAPAKESAKGCSTDGCKKSEPEFVPVDVKSVDKTVKNGKTTYRVNGKVTTKQAYEDAVANILK